jgi:hypothetical protein
MQKAINILITLLAIDDKPDVVELISEALQEPQLTLMMT